jgi:hypothetical protein
MSQRRKTKRQEALDTGISSPSGKSKKIARYPGSIFNS